ncbi:hypothetical protein SDC9_132659 [bioreactor metagenome]|uniref:Uncharacterized protein n=1 Tax=bioreactor metagenome TaxID=1076179 RepID=A0A645D953_9ZZZZ
MAERCTEDCFWFEQELENCPISHVSCCLSCDRKKDCEKKCGSV